MMDHGNITVEMTLASYVNRYLVEEFKTTNQGKDRFNYCVAVFKCYKVTLLFFSRLFCISVIGSALVEEYSNKFVAKLVSILCYLRQLPIVGSHFKTGSIFADLRSQK